MDIVTTLATAALAYLLGSVSFGLVAARLFGLGDLRRIGSGNIGATNVLRTGNKAAALFTLTGDAGKGAAAVLIARAVAGDGAAGIAALFAMLGHGAGCAHLVAVGAGRGRPCAGLCVDLLSLARRPADRDSVRADRGQAPPQHRAASGWDGTAHRR